jgi:hypothetical protein
LAVIARAFSVKQHPIRLNVAISNSSPISRQGMISVLYRKGYIGGEHSNNLANFFFVLVPFHHELVLALEICRPINMAH